MNTIIKESFKKLLADRYLLILISSMLLLSFILSIVVGFSVHPSELQLVSHYSAYGVMHLYRDQWYYLISFIAFGPVVAILHAIISIKLLVIRDRSLALVFAWLGIGVIIIGSIISLAVLNVWTPL